MPGGLSVRTDISAAELRRRARREAKGRPAARMYAIANVLAGMSRAKAAELAGMDRQALRDAVVRFNAEGIDGLYDRPKPGRPPHLTAEQQAELKALILEGPDPETDGLSAYTLEDICEIASRRWEVRYHPASMSRVVRGLGLSRQKPRPVHPETDQDAQEAFQKKGSRTL
jgi:transposase